MSVDSSEVSVFYRDVVGYLDYLDGVVGDVVKNVEERKKGVFKLLFMLVLLRMFEDFGLLSGGCVREVLRMRLFDDFLNGVYGILGKYVGVKFLRVKEDFWRCSGLINALRKVYEYRCSGRRGWKGLWFYDFRRLGSEALGGMYERFLEWMSKESKKEKGAYYTPKAIVEYMCRESLFYYLVSKLEGKIGEDGVLAFVRGNDVSGVKGYEDEVDRLLAEVRVCDPSCGTGAFLVGMLNEIVRLRKLVSDMSEYEVKKHAIENSLYGIDIDGMAVEVCKLRLWFSLVESMDRGDVDPLQSLRFNLVQGNALLRFPVEWMR